MSTEALHEFISSNCMPKDQDFQLASGESSSTYFDLKRLLLSGEGGFLASHELLRVMEESYPGVQVVGGYGLGARLVTVHLMMTSYKLGGSIISGFDVYEEDGEVKVANPPAPGTDIVIVDDVTTTGSSLFKAQQYVPQCNIVGGLVVVDRSGGHAQEALGFPVASVFTLEDF